MKHEIPWPLVIIGVLVVGAVFMLSQGATQTQSVGSTVIAPNNASTDQANAAIAASNAASANAYQQTIVQEFGQMVGFGSKIQDNLAAENLATLQVQRDEQIAALQAQTIQTQYNDQLAASNYAAHSSFLSGFWHDAFGFGSSLMGAVG